MPAKIDDIASKNTRRGSAEPKRNRVDGDGDKDGGKGAYGAVNKNGEEIGIHPSRRSRVPIG